MTWSVFCSISRYVSSYISISHSSYLNIGLTRPQGIFSLFDIAVQYQKDTKYPGARLNISNL